ncbi:hypothetical protein HUU05_26200 [candidate division KSB1 bacterium]|nr:hypothetical protein [candidate division KSB1 bacterium]
MPTLQYTSVMKKRLSQRAVLMLQASLRHFPELRDKTITVGYTRAHLGSAIREQLIIRLRVRKLCYNTIGHELTHLVQGAGGIPEGEKQCDIWTLARSPLFCDDAPTYLKLPSQLRTNWPQYAILVRELCMQAIELRKIRRNYIQWLERELSRLGKEQPQRMGQMSFAF